MDTFREFFPTISEKQWTQLMHYQTLLLQWNAKINLISRKSAETAFERHILPILPIVYLPHLRHVGRVMDVGTGGGIPGIPLAILYPQISFLLIDSIHKKVQAVQQMVETLHLQNIQTLCARVEQLKSDADLFVGRGVTAFENFIQWIACGTRSKHYAILYWTGGDVPTLQNAVQIYDLEAFFKHRYCSLKKIIYYNR